ncbi:MAG: hypothetical protein KBF94_04505, partial [Ilumatobacteraceae bacterium]|nr:hypothetical protein [Ilumatobacteraceae bacterium]
MTTGSVATGGAVDSVDDDVAVVLVVAGAVEAVGGSVSKGVDEPSLEHAASSSIATTATDATRDDRALDDRALDDRAMYDEAAAVLLPP